MGGHMDDLHLQNYPYNMPPGGYFMPAFFSDGTPTDESLRMRTYYEHPTGYATSDTTSQSTAPQNSQSPPPQSSQYPMQSAYYYPPYPYYHTSPSGFQQFPNYMPNYNYPRGAGYPAPRVHASGSPAGTGAAHATQYEDPSDYSKYLSAQGSYSNFYSGAAGSAQGGAGSAGSAQGVQGSGSSVSKPVQDGTNKVGDQYNKYGGGAHRNDPSGANTSATSFYNNVQQTSSFQPHTSPFMQQHSMPHQNIPSSQSYHHSAQPLTNTSVPVSQGGAQPRSQYSHLS